MTLPAPLAPLANIRQWVTYRLMPNDKGKTDKLPCNWQTGEISSAHEPGNWTTYDQAMSMAVLADRGHGHGAGFVLSPGDDFWFVDIDNCLTAERKWSPLALELCSRLAGAAIEVSQSGKGLHIIGTGAVPHHRCKNIPLGLELYTERRFIAITGTAARGDVSADLSGPLAGVIAEYFTPKADSGSGPLDDWTSEPCEGWVGSADDDALIRRARKQKPKPSAAAALRPGSEESVSFDDLWTGNVEALARQWPADPSSNSPYDASSADMSLAMRLAFWTGRDCERIERLMRMSGIMRDKYERRDYIERTIMLAAGGVTDVCKDKTPEPVPVGPPIEVKAPDGTLRMLQATDDKNSLQNVEAHLALAGRSVAYDEFADRILLDGQPLNDRTELLARADMAETYFIKFSKETFADGLRAAAYRNSRHPLREWLASTEPTWDGVPRLDRWLTTYLGVESTPYTDAVGAIFLTAAVRRARQPGCKFDELMILEGPQGIEKSTAVATLCPDRGWFSEDFTVKMDSKELLEATHGKWLVEAPELSKLTGAEVEHVKHLLSRQWDRARMAYERTPTDRGRQWVGFGTVNPTNDGYLSDPTGNRRFWPVKCGVVDVLGIERDRGQLWAEAAQRETAGASIRLPEALWALAAVEQDARVVVDPLMEILVEALGGFENGRIATSAIWDLLRIPTDRRSSAGRKVGDIMKRMGWTRRRVKREKDFAYAYFKGNEVSEIIWDVNTHKFIAERPRLQTVP